MSNKLILDTKYFMDIEEAVLHNSASTDGYARRQLKHVLNAFLENKTVIIKDIDVELHSIEEYKEWKKDRDLLNRYNSEILIKEIETNKSRNTWL